MWIRAFLLASLCGSLLTSSASQATIRFARFPAPSPDGKQVAFSWQGDLWLAPIAGGVAQRLTVHPAYDFAPIWSPDGKKIAFTSDRHGNDDVFVLHLDTGAVQRLTYFSARDRAWGWTPDSRAVLFESRRESEPYGADFSAYVAPLDGGTPYRLHKASGSPFALSPDGKRLAFVRRDSAWWRKGYKGSAQGDLWLLERATNRYVRLTDTDTPDTFPLWGADGRTLYFVSERDGTANLYAMDANTRRIRQLTRFKDDGIRFPQISANGAVITFEQGLDVYRLDTATGAIQPIPLQVPAQDARAAEQVRRTFSASVDDYAIAPDGKEFVFAVRGELFAARFPDGGPSRNLTETVEPEGDPQLAPDGKTLYFAAERDGTVQIYRLTSGDADEPRLRRARTHKIEPLTNAPQGASKPRLSPDGKRLAYQRGLGELVVRCLETQQERTLTESWNLGTIAWSPDSRWIAFDRYDENYNADVFVVRVPEFQTPTPDAEPKQEKQEPSGAGDAAEDVPVVYNISRHPRNDFAPSWSADGRALVFLSERETDTLNICHVWLRREDFERTRADREEEEDDKHDAPKKADEKKDPVRVEIDFDDLHLRVRLVTRYTAGVQEAVVAPDGEQNRLPQRVSGAARPLCHQVGRQRRATPYHRRRIARKPALEQGRQDPLLPQSGTPATNCRVGRQPADHAHRRRDSHQPSARARVPLRRRMAHPQRDLLRPQLSRRELGSDAREVPTLPALRADRPRLHGCGADDAGRVAFLAPEFLAGAGRKHGCAV
jgi:tricorn protease